MPNGTPRTPWQMYVSPTALRNMGSIGVSTADEERWGTPHFSFVRRNCQALRLTRDLSKSRVSDPDSQPEFCSCPVTLKSVGKHGKSVSLRSNALMPPTRLRPASVLSAVQRIPILRDSSISCGVRKVVYDRPLQAASEPYPSHNGRAHLLAHRIPACATSRGTQISANQDGGKTRGRGVLRNVPKDVTSSRIAVRLHARIIMVSGS
jgi:hypothetical protein